MTHKRKLHCPKGPDASASGKSPEGGGGQKRPDKCSEGRSTPPNTKRNAPKSGTEEKPLARQRPQAARDNVDKLTAPPIAQRNPSLGLVGGVTAYSLRRKSAANLSPLGGTAPPLSHAELHDDTVNAPDRSQSQATRPHEAPLQHTDASSASAIPKETRNATARRSFLLTCKETNWVSKSKRGMSDISTVSYSPAVFSRRKIAAIAGIAGIATALLFAAVIVFILSGHTPSRQNRQRCDTLSCRLHAQLLTKYLNRSIDPCEDFSAYVCSAWSPPTDRRERVKTPVDDMAFSRLATFRSLLVKGASKFPVAAKALEMHKSCMRAQDHGGSYLPKFLALMQEMGLSWPEPPRASTNALEMLRSLSYRWQVHLWFEVRVIVWRVSGQWLLVFRPASSLPFLLSQYNSVKDIRSYDAYWRGFYNDLSLNSTAPANDAVLKATIKDTHDIEGTVLVRLSEMITTQIRTPITFPLEEIGNHSRPITSDTWMNLLREHVALSPQISLTDDVYLINENLLVTIGGFLEVYPNSQLLSLYGWTFVQMFAPIGEPRMLLRRFGAKHKVDVYRSLFCSFHVEMVYKVLVLSLEMAIDNREKDREAFEAGFQKLVSIAVKKVEGAAWLNEDSRRATRVKLTSMIMQAWPEEQLMENEVLEEIYRDYPSTGGLFVELWIQARRVMHYASLKVRHINESQAYWDALRLSSNFPPSYPRHDYVLNTVKVPVYMFGAPLYYRGGTNAMFFGGLGYMLAFNLVKALDKEGVCWLTNGTQVDSILSEGARKAFQERDSCLSADGVASVFPELPAAEIAHAAMLDADNGAIVYVGEDISAGKAFFMTICYMSCTVHGFQSSYAPDCNKVARNSAAFASTFDCPSGSKMNSQKKCNFFG